MYLSRHLLDRRLLEIYPESLVRGDLQQPSKLFARMFYVPFCIVFCSFFVILYGLHHLMYFLLIYNHTIKKIFIYFWLCQVCLCSNRLSIYSTWAQLLMVHGILVPQLRIEPTFPILENASLITGLPGKAPVLYTFAFPASLAIC